MNYKVKKLEGKYEIEITLNKNEWESAVEGAYNHEKGKYNIEGFRKGKAPRKVIEKQYGSNVFFDHALSHCFYDNYTEILKKETKIEPIDSPSLDVKKLDENGVVLVATVDVMPEVKLGAYKKLGVKPALEKVTDAMVDEQLKYAIEKNVRFVESKTAIANGNVANIDFEGYVDGKLFDGGTAKGFDLEIGSKSFIDNFEEQLIGLKENDKKDIAVTFPKEYHAKNLAGKKAIFKVSINSVKIKEYPVLDDKFASNVSGFNTLEEYKKDIKKQLQKQAETEAERKLENAILDKIIANMQSQIPNVMVENELDAIMKDMEYRLMYQGLTLESYAGYLKTTVDKIKQERKEDALKSVKIRLAMQEIIKKEKIAVTDEELNEKIKEMAKTAKKSIKEFKTTLDDNRLNYLKNDILVNKLLTFLKVNN